ncbi:MAG: acyl-CoA dehydratase activase [Ardenticatenia bacterium]|nr:acyl-CoA dehydratase activase [Ardenticatenia bacterium]
MYTAGVDVGSTYTKAVIVDGGGELVGKSMVKTGFKLDKAASRALQEALGAAGLAQRDIAYIVSTGYGRYQVPFRDTQVTDLTAHARAAHHFFPRTRTVLDVGGQTMKALRLDEEGKVRAFRLNDKCAAGRGAFLEKTARYMGYEIEEIGTLIATSKEPVPISGVCAVFAESEVINHVSQGASPADIMHGAIVSLVGRSVQLMKRVRGEPEYTLVGGIMRFTTMVEVVCEELRIRVGEGVNLLPDDLVQFNGAIGAAILAQRRLQKLADEGRLDDHLRRRAEMPLALAG